MKRHFLVVAILAATASHAQNWPSFRGSAAEGVGAGRPPVEWDVATNRNVAWKTAIPGLGLSSPVVWGNVVYLTTAVSSAGETKLVMKNDGVVMADDQVAHTWHVLAIDRRSGKVLWNSLAHEGVPRVKRHVKSSFANATPATDGKHVVALMGAEVLVAFNSQGKLLWKKTLELNNPKDVFDQASSPVLYRNTVILQNDREKQSYLAAYDLDSGKEVWRVERSEGSSWSTPSVLRGRDAAGKLRNVLVTQSGKFIRGLDPATGKELWRMAQNDPEPWDRIPAPVAAGDNVIVAGGNPNRPIFAIRTAAEGDITLAKEQQSNASIPWVATRGGTYMPTPVVFNGLLYVLRENGVLSAFRVASGELLYQQRLGSGGFFSASPVVAGSNLYISNDDGEWFVVRAGEKFELVKQNAMGEMCFATPALAGDMLIVRTQKNLYAIAQNR